MISVIIPAYNVEKYIDTCLRSVMNQKEAEYEVVLVNDGSKDQTGVLCRKWAEDYKNIKYIEQENKGQGTARNVAIENASGEWLVFLDADDEMAEDALAELQSCVAEDVGTDIVWYEHTWIRDDKVSEVVIEVENADKKKIMRSTTTFLWDKMFRKGFWKHEGLYLSDLYGEDILPVYALLAKATNIKLIHKSLVIHYERNDNLSSNKERVLELPISIRNTLHYFKEAGLFEEYQKELLIFLYRQIKLYQYVISLDVSYAEKIIQALEEMAETQFSERQIGYEFVFIGGVENIRKDVVFFGAFHYECLEKYLMHQIERKSKYCNIIIDVENEVKSYFCGTRTEDWVCARWREQCQELLHNIARNYNMGGITVVYRSPKTHPIYRRLEQIAMEVLHCPIIDEVLDIIELPERTLKSIEHLQDYQSLNFRGEYLRLEYNNNVLKRWLEWKLQNISLEHFFIKNGYKNIAIYGMGYLGVLLWQELRGKEVAVEYFLERQGKPDYMGVAVYGIEDMRPKVDVIVVTVVHQYDLIRNELLNNDMDEEVALISLEDVLEI